MRLVTALCAGIAAAALGGPTLAAPNVSLDPQAIGKPPVDNWTTFNGDYSGQRYSPLTQITPANVDQIAQQWAYQITGVSSRQSGPATAIKCTPLLVNGTLYITIPDHVWALNARDGKEIWHYDWVDHGGHLIGQRGVGMWKTTVYFETPDNWLLALNATTGKELWRGRLPAGGQATPMTYVWKGRQYVVIAAGGHGKLQIKQGDYLMAFALPGANPRR